MEMEDAAKKCGFNVIAAVAEQSIIPQYAANRPDASDEAQLADFAGRILQKDGAVASIPGIVPTRRAVA